MQLTAIHDNLKAKGSGAQAYSNLASRGETGIKAINARFPPPKPSTAFHFQLSVRVVDGVVCIKLQFGERMGIRDVADWTLLPY